MTSGCDRCWDRRRFLMTGMGSMAALSIPGVFGLSRVAAAALGPAATGNPVEGIDAVVREETLFAGIRKPIKERAELEPRIAALEKACRGKVAGPLTHIFRFDTPVDGFDSEIGFPVSEEVNSGEISTHRLRRMHFYSALHEGPVETLRDTSRSLYQHMRTTGLSPELELVEVYHRRDTEHPSQNRTEVRAAFLAWPEVYREQLLRVLDPDKAALVFKGGEEMTPHVPVDPRAAWVAASIKRLKACTTQEQQFDILSRVALVRPPEDVAQYQRLYDESGDITTVFKAMEERLRKTPTGGFLEPPRYDGTTLHVSKVPYNKEEYAKAKTHREKRKAYCFCNLVREAEDPQIDPIFCYRAAGWSRQLWEPILGVEFKACTITSSILKGDDFCAWDYHIG